VEGCELGERGETDGLVRVAYEGIDDTNLVER
jgi:hypothetical protein